MSQRTRFTRARVLILGENGVGKTAFAVRYITKRFIGDYDQNKEMMYTCKAHMERDEIIAEIMDTANNTDGEALQTHIKWADGYVLVYSLTDRASFDKIPAYYTQVQECRKHDESSQCFLPLVIVATKVDLEHARCITEEEGLALAKRLGSPVHEISVAENPDGVHMVMTDVLKQVKREFVRNLVGLEKRSPLTNMKRVFRRKMTRSKSDTLKY